MCCIYRYVLVVWCCLLRLVLLPGYLCQCVMCHEYVSYVSVIYDLCVLCADTALVKIHENTERYLHHPWTRAQRCNTRTHMCVWAMFFLINEKQIYSTRVLYKIRLILTTLFISTLTGYRFDDRQKNKAFILRHRRRRSRFGDL